VQRPASGVWAALWSLPEFDTSAGLEDLVEGWPGAGEWLTNIEHALTHFDWTLQPMRWTLPARGKLPAGLPEGRWFTRPEALALGLPAPIRRLLET
jgi:A/G-specific adenine glycosylase